MDYLVSKHADGLSKLMLKAKELLKEMAIASLMSEMDIKYVLYNMIKELSVTLEEIRFKAKCNKFITHTKKGSNI